MQSIRQYREIGRRVAVQYQSKERPRPRGSSSTVSPPLDALEKGDADIPKTGLEVGEDIQSGAECNLEDLQRHVTDIGRTMTGINVRRRTTREGGGDNEVFVVGFQGEDDPLNPHRWSLARRIWIL